MCVALGILIQYAEGYLDLGINLRKTKKNEGKVRGTLLVVRGI